MNSVSIAIVTAQRAYEFKQCEAAQKDFSWWARQIAKAASKGERSCENHARLAFWRRHHHHSYVSELQKLLGEGVKVRRHEYERTDGYVSTTGTTVSW